MSCFLAFCLILVTTAAQAGDQVFTPPRKNENSRHIATFAAGRSSAPVSRHLRLAEGVNSSARSRPNDCPVGRRFVLIGLYADAASPGGPSPNPRMLSGKMWTS
jgi:hypothetical protein